MISSSLSHRRLCFGAIVLLCIFAFTACDYEVPITPSPTRKVQERLLGNWTSSDGKEKMRVRRLDDSIYVVYYDGDLFRAYHSDVAETAFVSVQDLNSSDRKYAYVIWNLSDDGKHLRLRSVNRNVVPQEKRDSTAIAKFLEENAKNPDLFGEEIQFDKET